MNNKQKVPISSFLKERESRIKPVEANKLGSKDKKTNRLRESLPIFWSSYQHMFDVRERKTKGMIDFLLIISTFLPVLAVALYSTDLLHNWLILLPIIPQIISIVVLLKYFVVGNPAVHWFKLDENLLKKLENNNFEIETIVALKKLEGLTWISMNAESSLIRRSRNLILLSLFMLMLSAVFVLFVGNYLLYIFLLVILIISYYVYFVFYREKPNFSENSEDVKNFKLLVDWVNKK
jgi:hypothetical protein